jgi:hypothetical protein
MNTIPKIEIYLPEFTTFVRQMATRYQQGEFNDYGAIEAQVNAFFTPAVSAQMAAKVPGWAEMTMYQQGRTQTHVVCVLITMYSLPEFKAASPLEKLQLEWIGLLHDIAKRPPAQGIREHIHAFTSAAAAAPILPLLGLPVTAAYPGIIFDWQELVRSASILQGDMEYPDNTQLPDIMGGLDAMFGADRSAALIIKTILLHLSFSWIADWPSAAPLSDDEVRAYLDESVLAALIIMALMDTDAYALFDAPRREKYRREILAFKAETLKIIRGE